MYLADLDCGGHQDPDPRKANLTPAELAIAMEAFAASKAVASRSEQQLRLRASKPVKASPAGQYVWRMIVFAIPKGAGHHCLPVTADWSVREKDIPAGFEPAIDIKWLAAAAIHSENTEEPGTFETLNRYPYIGHDETPAKDWEDYHARRWPRERRRRYLKYLDTIADRVIATVSTRKQAGTMAWQRALHG